MVLNYARDGHDVIGQNIILVGFMGTGKSSVGQKLAQKLGWSFIDVDQRIEQHQQKTIPELFREYGELYFRQVESICLAQALTQFHQVIATGGGAVLDEKNRKLMLESGYVVALTASAHVIVARLRHDHNRPLLEGNLAERVTTLIEQRKHAYQFAHLSIDTSAVSMEHIANEILLSFAKASDN